MWQQASKDTITDCEKWQMCINECSNEHNQSLEVNKWLNQSLMVNEKINWKQLPRKCNKVVTVIIQATGSNVSSKPNVTLIIHDDDAEEQDDVCDVLCRYIN